MLNQNTKLGLIVLLISALSIFQFGGEKQGPEIDGEMKSSFV
jgi:hypothetical protein